MTETELLDKAYLDRLPPEWNEDLLETIRGKLKGSDYKLIILDDDPTGTQTVVNIPVLTDWSEELLVEELQKPYPAFFILTNSRSLVESEACILGSELGACIKAASEKAGVPTVIISRSDSTLRGHFPAEVDAVADAAGDKNLPYLIIPFFYEGGRFTLDDIHYVADGEKLVPAALTPFASDASFGFTHSNMKLWVEEKTKGAVSAENVASVTIDDIRVGGPGKVAGVLRGVKENRACVVNAASYRDMEVVVKALMEVEEEGIRFLYRTAASFVRTRLGMDSKGKLLTREDMGDPTAYGGLFVVGSYVPKTTVQLEALIARADVTGVEIRVEKLLDDQHRNSEIEDVAERVDTSVKAGRDVAIFTSRNLVTGADQSENLAIGNLVSQSLIKIVQALTIKPKFLVAKGGITSSDVATKGLGVKRAMVLGQIQPGVPVWKLGEETKYPGMSYVVFPGNVGSDDALAEIQELLSR